MPGSLFGGRTSDFASKADQIAALTGWVFAANSAIAESAAAVEIKLYKKQKNGERQEITRHEILDLINAPNAVYTGEQLRQLHHTYMNIVGRATCTCAISRARASSQLRASCQLPSTSVGNLSKPVQNKVAYVPIDPAALPRDRRSGSTVILIQW